MNSLRQSQHSKSTEQRDQNDNARLAREAMKQVCIARMTAFGQAGNAGKIKPITLDEMAKRYRVT